MSSHRYRRLNARTVALKKAGLHRTLHPLTMTSATTARRDGRDVTVFCSNDYLGLAGHPDVQAAWQGQGTGSARLISGDRPAHHELEDALSKKFGQTATLMSSGYHANLALTGVLLERGDIVVSDALNHASIIDGLRLTHAERIILPHGIANIPADTRLAVVEGLYSMDGDVLNLSHYTGDHWLCVDEAHAFGVMGPQGRGVAAAQGITPDAIVGTLGKAIGAYGAFIIGPPEIRELLVSQGRSFVFTTGLPEPAARAALVGLAMANDERRGQLSENVNRLRRGLTDLNIDALGCAHIVPIVLGEHAMRTSADLLTAGFLVPGIRPPTVAAGKERIRVTLSAAHTEDQIDGLLAALEQAVCLSS